MVNPIMTQTLPTVISMGVVSRAVETTMGKRRRRAVSRKKEQTIRIDGRERKLYIGERGGQYYVTKGRKVYVPKWATGR